MQIYQSLFNNLLIDKNQGVLIRVEPVEAFLNQQTDSLWYSRGNLSPFYAMDEDQMLNEEELFLEDAQKNLLENGIGAQLGNTITSIGHTIEGGDWTTRIGTLNIVLEDPKGGIKFSDLDLVTAITENAEEVEEAATAAATAGS